MRRTAWDSEYDREARLSVDQLKAKYGGENWGLGDPPRSVPPTPAPSWDAVTDAYSDDPSRLQRLLSAREKAL
jgi:hypothetical protein